MDDNIEVEPNCEGKNIIKINKRDNNLIIKFINSKGEKEVMKLPHNEDDFICIIDDKTDNDNKITTFKNDNKTIISYEKYNTEDELVDTEDDVEDNNIINSSHIDFNKHLCGYKCCDYKPMNYYKDKDDNIIGICRIHDEEVKRVYENNITYIKQYHNAVCKYKECMTRIDIKTNIDGYCKKCRDIVNLQQNGDKVFIDSSNDKFNKNTCSYNNCDFNTKVIYGTKGNNIITLCNDHEKIIISRYPDMECLSKSVRMLCSNGLCTKSGHIKDTNGLIYCAKCRDKLKITDYESSVPKCIICKEVDASFKKKGTSKKLYCHKCIIASDELDIDDYETGNLKCKYCGQRAGFAKEGSKADACGSCIKEHRLKGYKDATHTKCHYCKTTRASFKDENGNNSCDTCMKELGISGVDVAHSKCKHCNIVRPSFRKKGATKLEYCYKCMTELNLENKYEDGTRKKCIECKDKMIYHTKYDDYCTDCYYKLNPDTDRFDYVRESAVIEYIEDNYKIYSPVYNTILDDSRLKPDIIIKYKGIPIIIEVDENQHKKKYYKESDNEREQKIYRIFNENTIVFIRFNPDGYKIDKKKISSPWRNNKIINEEEWDTRLSELDNIIFKSKKFIKKNINSSIFKKYYICYDC